MDLLFNEGSFPSYKTFGIIGLGLASFGVITYLFQNFDSQDPDEPGSMNDNKKPAGIFNEGNTCFVNSLLQALASLRLLKNNLEYIFEDHEKGNNDHELLLQELKDAIEKINSSEEKVDIRQFLDVLGSLHANLINMEQQDAHQLYSVLMGSFDHVLNQRKTISLHSSRYSCDPIDLEQEMMNPTKALDSRMKNLQNPLLGYTKTSFTCTSCRTQHNIKINPFYDLSCEIAPMHIRSIYDALQQFQTKEEISGWICTTCSINSHIKKLTNVREELKKNQPRNWEMLLTVSEKIQQFCNRIPVQELDIQEVNEQLGTYVLKFKEQYDTIGKENSFRDKVFIELAPVQRTIVKQTIITKLPKILVIHLKQLSINPYTGEPILLRKSINFGQTIKCPIHNDQWKTYKLTSLLSHMGNEDIGHYYTFRKISQESVEWFMISDTFSRRCKFEALRMNVPYMLFYELEN